VGREGGWEGRDRTLKAVAYHTLSHTHTNRGTGVNHTPEASEQHKAIAAAGQKQ